MNAHQPGITIDEALRLILGAERRAVLRYLIAAGNSTVHVEELVAAIEAETRESDGERILLALHHRHLPRLAAAGIVAYDADGRCVRYQPNESIEELLTFVSEEFESTVGFD